MCLLLVGNVSRTSFVTAVWRRTFCTSTSGLSPVTVIVSSSAPTCSSTLTFAVTPALMLIPSRRMTLNPGNVKLTSYVPVLRSMRLKRPSPSVNTTRTPSIRAGLDASTVTPGRTPPELSVTSPPMPPVLCADAVGANSNTPTSIPKPIRLRFTGTMRSSPSSTERLMCEPLPQEVNSLIH